MPIGLTEIVRAIDKDNKKIFLIFCFKKIYKIKI